MKVSNKDLSSFAILVIYIFKFQNSLSFYLRAGSLPSEELYPCDNKFFDIIFMWMSESDKCHNSHWKMQAGTLNPLSHTPYIISQSQRRIGTHYNANEWYYANVHFVAFIIGGF